MNKAGAGHGVQFTMSQAVKGIGALHFIHDHFGGSINLQLPGDEKNQRAYDYSLNGDNALRFARAIEPYLLIKKREAARFMEFPNCNLHIIPIVAKHETTGEERRFATLKECAQSLGLVSLAFIGREVIRSRSWEIRKSLTPDEVAAIKAKRKELFVELKELKKKPHDPIPDDYVPTDAYFAGFFDGDGKVGVTGKSGHCHSIDQKYPAICNLFKRAYGGTCCQYTHGGWKWSIYTFGDEFIRRIAPFIQGKKKQVTLVLNMKAGDAQEVHANLRLLKGKGERETPRIDRYNRGEGPQFTAARELPKGVFPTCGGKYLAQIQHSKTIYVLGKFTKPSDAHDLYNKVKHDVAMAKANGRAIDLSMYHASTTKK